MKIAVIGTGIAGNVAAYQLAKQHQVSVFEANDYVGGHTHTHDIDWQGQEYAIDTGFIVFNERTYPNFIGLLDTLEVPFETTEMSFSMKDGNSGLEYCGSSLNAMFSQRRNLLSPKFYRMIYDILRFNRSALREITTQSCDLSFGEFLRKGKYSKQFIEHYIVPMGAAIWSTDPGLMEDFPAEFFIRFFHNHGLLTVRDQPQWFVVSGGSRQYLAPLCNSFKQHIKLNSAIESITRSADAVTIQAHGKSPETFDAVFIATHSDQALEMLSDPSPLEAQVLGAIKYQYNQAVLHTDESVLPTNRRAWGAWNYHLAKHSSEPSPQRVALTYNMNILQNIDAPVQFCVTLNNDSAIDPAKIIKRIDYHHPLFTQESVQAQSRQKDLNGTLGTYYCGAYWGNGFHEDGVRSAQAAVAQFEQQLAVQAK